MKLLQNNYFSLAVFGVFLIISFSFFTYYHNYQIKKDVEFIMQDIEKRGRFDKVMQERMQIDSLQKLVDSLMMERGQELKMDDHRDIPTDKPPGGK